MAVTIEITDGSTTVSLKNTTGFEILRRGWVQGVPRTKNVHKSSIFAPGRSLIQRSDENVIERFSLVLQGSSADNLASQLQQLRKLIDQAQNYQLVGWENAPVYLSAKTDSETETRYSMVKDGDIQLTSSLIDCEVTEDNVVNGLTVIVEREPYWRNLAPGSSLPTALSLSAPDAPETASEQWIANCKHGATISKVYSYDATATAFSSDLSASTSFNYFEVSGSTPAVGDMFYVGSDDPFFCVIMNIGTAFVGSGVTVAEEYWNGAAWTSGARVARAFVESDVKTGTMAISFDGNSSWAKTTINGQNLYWIRLRITAITTWTTSPAQANQALYIVNDTYIEFANDQIDGDEYPMVRTQLRNDGMSTSAIVAMGLKTRGLTNFRSRLNCNTTSDNGNWSISQFNNTADNADPRGPDGYVSRKDFTASGAVSPQVSISLELEEFPDDSKDFVGSYFVYVRAEQENGSDGDCSIYVTVSELSKNQNTKTVYLSDTDTGPELLPMGYITIGQPKVPVSDNAGASELDIKVFIGSLSNTTYVNVWDVILIPVDEWGMVITEQDIVLGNILDDRDTHIIDPGLIAERAYSERTFNGEDYIDETLEVRGLYPKIPPETQGRIYFVVGERNFSSIYGENGTGFAFGMYTHELWNIMRGSS